MAAGEAILKPMLQNPFPDSNPPTIKKKRNLPGTPDPQAEVIALSPKTLLATNRFLCEICGKGFQRDQNLQLHRRGHNLPWKLKQRGTKEPRKRVYVCPEKSCVHHNPARALGDLTGIKKHFCRKHGEKKWKCEKCSKRYAVQSDWKAHSKTCGTREYRCDCGTLFSRRDSFVTHRAFCDALAEEAARISGSSNISSLTSTGNMVQQQFSPVFKNNMAHGEVIDQCRPALSLWMGQRTQNSETMSSRNNSLSDLHHIPPPPLPLGSSNLYGDSQQVDYSYQYLSWLYGDKISSSNSGELTSTTSLPTSYMKDVGSPNMSVPSLYSTQHHQPQHQSSPDMSATALLQKAAQIGVTSSNDAYFMGRNINLKCSSNNNKNGHVEDHESYSTGLLFSPNQVGDVLTGLESSAGDFSTLNQLETMRRSEAQRNLELEGGQTRDFLGVGVQALCLPSIHGWI